MKSNNKNNYLISCVCSIFILMTICYFGIGYLAKDTYAGFGGLTACMVPTLNVTYMPNYPDGMEEPEVFVKGTCESHKILSNMFDVPSGYEFVGWNTLEDGSGGTYHANTFAILSGDTTLYALWKLIPVEEEPETNIISYGDVNQNGQIDADDYFLIEKYLNDSSVLTEDRLINADVNADGKIDEVDADIVKQVYLGTEGYTGYLPEKSIPIYSVYEENTNEDNKDENLSDDEENDDTTDGDSSSDTTTGNAGNNVGPGGTGGNGTGSALGGSSSGTGTGGNTTGSVSGNKPSNNNSSNQNSNTNNDNNKEEVKNENKEEEVKEPIVYKFKFMNSDKEYASTSCEVLNGSTCDLILPKNNPARNGYTFTGWSLTKDCPSESGIIDSVIVNEDNIYYACFKENSSNKKWYSIVIVGFIIVMIWGLATYGIYYLIKRFRETEIGD